MEGAHEIVLQALEQAGVTLPAGGCNVQDLSPSSLVSICTTALALIQDSSPAPSSPLPASMAERFRICTGLASSIKDLGYDGDLGFHQFLYPSEEETYKLLRFLLDKLSKSSIRFANESMTSGMAKEAIFHCHVPPPSQQGLGNEATEVLGLEDTGGSNFAPEMKGIGKGSIGTSGLEVAKGSNPALETKACASIFLVENPKPSVPSASDINVEVPLFSTMDLTGSNVLIMGKSSLEDQVVSGHSTVERSSLSPLGKEHQEECANFSLDGQEDLSQRDLWRLEERLNSVIIEKTKLTKEVADLSQNIKDLERECEASSMVVRSMKRARDFLKRAAVADLDSSLLEDTTFLRGALHAEQDGGEGFLEAIALMQEEDLQGKLEELNKVRQEIEDREMKFKRREDELAVLTKKLEGGVKGPSRSSHVLRIIELIKNSKKQDRDISRIIGDIRELQRQSNANQGRLKRTYALVDELVFRDAQKDPMCRQAYRLLTSIHEDFAECYEKVFAIDRVRREIADLQLALEETEKWPVDPKQVQADIDVLIGENMSLERRVEAMNKKPFP